MGGSRLCTASAGVPALPDLVVAEEVVKPHRSLTRLQHPSLEISEACAARLHACIAAPQGTQDCVCKLRPGKSCSFWYAAVLGTTSRFTPARGRAPRCLCGQPPASAACRGPPAAPAQCSAPVYPANNKNACSRYYTMKAGALH